jgi:hypothetical protein
MPRVNVKFDQVWNFAGSKFGNWTKLPPAQLMRCLRSVIACCCNSSSNKVTNLDVIRTLRLCATQVSEHIPERTGEILQRLSTGVLASLPGKTGKTEVMNAIAHQLLTVIGLAPTATPTRVDETSQVFFIVGKPDIALAQKLKVHFASNRPKK